jgi:hypothetical protein
MLQSWQMSNEEVLLPSDQTFSKTIKRQFSQLPTEVRLSIQNELDEDFADNEVISSVQCLSVDNIIYKVKYAYILNVVEEEHVPIFLIVKYIICIRNVWVICGRLLIPNLFNVHMHAYNVVEDCTWVTCRPGDFRDHSIQDYFEHDNSLFVSLRYACC